MVIIRRKCCSLATAVHDFMLLQLRRDATSELIGRPLSCFKCYFFWSDDLLKESVLRSMVVSVVRTLRALPLLHFFWVEHEIVFALTFRVAYGPL